MAPVIHLVRHAEGYHNVSTENQKLRDPDLTPLGETQCRELCEKFRSQETITHLVASPIRRTLQTCLQSFPEAVQAGKTIIALPDAQEVSALPCDTGSDPEKLKSEFGNLVDFSLVGDGWNDKSVDSKYYPSTEKLAARAHSCRRWLRDLAFKEGNEAVIILVTHGGILHFLTQDWEGVLLDHGTGWNNTELRSYAFEDEAGKGPNATLKELESSSSSRRGDAIPLTTTEQEQLEAAFKASFEAEMAKADVKIAALKKEEEA